eukprot:GEMP01010895.1.p1 GENE.GEMP01010895.1~~GEMP01010895.1.p1  ORF type:complete len:597 (+),score=148.07 GEMP01010895.1:35-1825(+)
MEQLDSGDTPVSTPLPPSHPYYAQHPSSPGYKMQPMLLGKRFCMPKLFPQTPTRFLHLNPVGLNCDRSATPSQVFPSPVTITTTPIGHRASMPRSHNSMVANPLGLTHIGSNTDLLGGHSNRNGSRRHSIVSLASATPVHYPQQRQEPVILPESGEDPVPLLTTSPSPYEQQAPPVVQAPRFMLSPQQVAQVSQPPVMAPTVSPIQMALPMMRATASPPAWGTVVDAKGSSLEITANTRPGARPLLACSGLSVPDPMSLQPGNFNKMQPTPSRNQIAHERFKELEAKAAELEAEKVDRRRDSEHMGAQIEAQSADIDGLKRKMAENAFTQQEELQNLKADYGDLLFANDALRAGKMDLTRDLDDIKVEAAVLKASNATMAAKNDDLETDNSELKAKLAETQLRLSELEGSAGKDIKGLKGKLRELQMQYDATRLLNEELRTRLAKSIAASRTNSPFPSQQDSCSVKSGVNSPSNWSCASSNSMIPPPRSLAARRAAAQNARHTMVAGATTRSSLRSMPSGTTPLAARTSLPLSKLGDKARPKSRPSLPLATGKAKAKAKVRPAGTPASKSDQLDPWWKEEDTADFEKMEAFAKKTA